MDDDKFSKIKFEFLKLRCENVEILKLLEQLQSSVKTVSNCSSASPSVSSQNIQVYSPKPIRNNKSFKAKSYFSLADDSMQQPHQPKRNQIFNASNNVSMAATKIINLKRNSVNLAHQGQLSIEALKTKTKDLFTGKHLTKSFSMHESQPHQQSNSQQQQQYLNGKHIQLVKIRLRQTCENDDLSNVPSNPTPTTSQNQTVKSNKNITSNNRTDASNVNTINSNNQFLNNEIFYI